MTGLRHLEGVATLALDPEKCTGCGMCAAVCPHGVFEIRPAEGPPSVDPPAAKKRKARLADKEACMECGACARNCPEGALTVQAGVGCAAASVQGALRGTEPSCDCC